MGDSQDISGEIERLAQLKSRDEIARASHYWHIVFDSKEACKKNKSFAALAAKNGGWDRIMTEVELFELMDQISDFFIPQQELDADMLDSLGRSARLWANLASTGSLPAMEQNSGLEESNVPMGTVAERFREHLAMYRRKLNFEVWTQDHIHRLRSGIYQELEETREARPAAKTKVKATILNPSKEVKAKLKNLKREVGYIRTTNQIIKASHYLDHIRNSEKDNIKDLARRELVNTNRPGIDCGSNLGRSRVLSYSWGANG